MRLGSLAGKNWQAFDVTEADALAVFLAANKVADKSSPISEEGVAADMSSKQSTDVQAADGEKAAADPDKGTKKTDDSDKKAA